MFDHGRFSHALRTFNYPRVRAPRAGIRPREVAAKLLATPRFWPRCYRVTRATIIAMQETVFSSYLTFLRPVGGETSNPAVSLEIIFDRILNFYRARNVVQFGPTTLGERYGETDREQRCAFRSFPCQRYRSSIVTGLFYIIYNYGAHEYARRTLYTREKIHRESVYFARENAERTRNIERVAERNCLKNTPNRRTNRRYDREVVHSEK